MELLKVLEGVNTDIKVNQTLYIDEEREGVLYLFTETNNDINVDVYSEDLFKNDIPYIVSTLLEHLNIEFINDDFNCFLCYLLNNDYLSEDAKKQLLKYYILH